MNTKTTFNRLVVMGLIVTGAALVPAYLAYAHCDTLSGPVVTDAQTAIKTKDVTPVLKWVRPEDEREIKALFEQTLAARQQSAGVQELVDLHFFETLVRVHRAGEGAPYTGLKPADTPLEPGIEVAETALASESDGALVHALQKELESSVHARFERVAETKKHKDDSVEAGRAYVAAYVDYIHYVEALHAILSGAATHGHEQEKDEHSQAETAPSKPGDTHRH